MGNSMYYYIDNKYFADYEFRQDKAFLSLYTHIYVCVCQIRREEQQKLRINGKMTIEVEKKNTWLRMFCGLLFLTAVDRTVDIFI